MQCHLQWREAQVLSRFRAGLRDDLRTELLASEVTELEKAYVLVQDLDAAKSNSISEGHTKQSSLPRVSTSSAFKDTSIHKADIKGKSVQNKGKGVDKEFSKLTATIKCYKCKGYGHVAANCPTPVKISLINGKPEIVSESE